MRKYYYFWISLLIILLDQATKLRVKFFMELGESISVLGDFFRITYVTNTGAAFSLSLGSESFDRFFFIAMSIIAVVVLFFLFRKNSSKLAHIAYAFILGGAVGNLVDRLLYGAVIDFLDFDFFDFIIARWPVFNVADSAIVVAMFLLIIDIFLTEKKEEHKIINGNYQTIEENI